MKSVFKIQLLYIIFILILFSCQKKSKKVPFISKKLIENKATIGNFNFANQFNKSFEFSSLQEKIHIVNFFFTTCKTICPLMEIPLNKLATKNQTVQFISFTIDPENDTIAVLEDYYQQQKNTNRTFLRGTKKEIKQIAELYLSSVNNQDDANLYHTSYVILIDKKMNIRGLYNSLETADVNFLKQDLKVLLKE